MARPKSDPQSPKRTAGRPRVLTLLAIIEAACAIEPSDFSMTAVAQKLGVSVGTLYTYVESRNELERWVSLRRLRSSRITDTGQTWQEVIRTLIRNAVIWFAGDPRTFIRYQEGTVGLMDGLDVMEDAFAILVRRGFTIRQAVDAYRGASLLAMGLALARVHHLAAVERGWTHKVMFERQQDMPGREPTPTVLQAAEFLMDDAAYSAPEGPVEQLIAGIEAQLSRSSA
jgi:AcrR family transcriptional regulator